MSEHCLSAYQVDVLDFKKRNHKPPHEGVFHDTKGIYICLRCSWEGYWEKQCPKCDNKEIFPKGRIKVEDILSVAQHRRTLVGLFFNKEKAKRWGSRYGTVISCRKVDKSRYLENIEHLNLKQEPPTIELAQEEFVLSRTLELERPRRRYDVDKININIIDEDVDK
jgi:hypothetical protein